MFDLKAFGTDLGLSTEELGQIETVLGKPERLAALEKNQLRQSDYSKQANALKTAQTELQTKSDRLTAEMAEWATLTAAEKDASSKQREALEKTQQQVLKLQQRVTKIATDAGLDPAQALEGIDQPAKREDPPPPPPIDTSKFVGVDQFQALNNYLFNLTAELPMIAQEHFDLTGERLDTRALHAEILNISKDPKANIDPRAIWEAKYAIPAKRAAQVTAARALEIKTAEERGYNQARSEAALPVAPSRGTHSPLFKSLDGPDPAKPHTSKLSRPQPESTVQAAASALATGKYRPKPAA